MIKSLSSISHGLYIKLIKPQLFRMAPDGVHDKMIKTGNFAQRFGFIRWIMSTIWAYNNPEKLGQNLHGINFANPVGLSAGLDKNFEIAPLIKAVGFGLIEGGSVTFRQCDGNPRPWFYRLPQHQSLVVNAGLANHGVKSITKHIKAYPQSLTNNFPLNISVAKTNSKEAASEKDAIADYIGSLEYIKQQGIGQMITINISCPNTYGGEPFTTPKRLENLLKEIDRVKMGQPVFIKMPINLPWAEFKELLDVIAKHKITGLTIGNLNKDRSAGGKELPADVPGNLSGKPTFKLSNDLIAKTYQSYGNRFTIIGVGGIFTAEDAYLKIKNGASLVEMVTGLIFEGPAIVGRINSDLVKLLDADGYTNISQAIGANFKK